MEEALWLGMELQLLPRKLQIGIFLTGAEIDSCIGHFQSV